MKYAYQLQQYFGGWLEGGRTYGSLACAAKHIRRMTLTRRKSFRLVRYPLNGRAGVIVWKGYK